MKKSKGKKIIIGLVVGVLATTAIVCAAVPQVRQSIKGFINKLKDGDIHKTDKEKAQEKAHDDDFYKDLDDDEKNEFDKKLNDIVDSDHYKNLDDEEKDKLLEKFVESEKTIKEVSQDPKDKKPEEIENKISDKQNELENVQKEIEDLKNSGASEEEIAKAEEKQQQVENQIKEAEQEKAYWETVETVKDSTAVDEVFAVDYPGLSIRRINGIYEVGSSILINADFIRQETIDGRNYFSRINQFVNFSHYLTGEETYQEILEKIQNCPAIVVESSCVKNNDPSHVEFFNQNKTFGNVTLEFWQNEGCPIELVESWEQENDSHPNYILKVTDADKEYNYIVTYNANFNNYRVMQINKICPEFWAQLEIERSQTAKTSAEAKAQAALDEISTKDENGEMTGFDWNAYRALKEKQEAKDQEKISSQNADQKVELSYSEKELGF